MVLVIVFCYFGHLNKQTNNYILYSTKNDNGDNDDDDDMKIMTVMTVRMTNYFSGGRREEFSREWRGRSEERSWRGRSDC